MALQRLPEGRGWSWLCPGFDGCAVMLPVLVSKNGPVLGWTANLLADPSRNGGAETRLGNEGEPQSAAAEAESTRADSPGAGWVPKYPLTELEAREM